MRQNTLDKTFNPREAAFERIEAVKRDAFYSYLKAVQLTNPKLAEKIEADLMTLLSVKGTQLSDII